MSGLKQHEEKLLQELKLGSRWETFEAFCDRKLTGIATGIRGWDMMTLGLQGITTIQGEPKCCKSSLVLQAAHNAARSGHPVLVVDRENGLQRLRTRMTCQSQQISQVDVLTATREKRNAWTREVRELPVYVLTSPPRDHEIVLSYVRQLYAEYRKPVLLVVDSLQALPKIKEDERINIQYWMEFFDQVKVSGDGKVYILMTSEKKRGAYESASMEGGKGSNAIEYKSEVLLDLRRNSRSGAIIMSCKAFRDGVADWEIELEKVLACPEDERSFTFTLREVGGSQI